MDATTGRAIRLLTFLRQLPRVCLLAPDRFVNDDAHLRRDARRHVEIAIRVEQVLYSGLGLTVRILIEDKRQYAGP